MHIVHHCDHNEVSRPKDLEYKAIQGYTLVFSLVSQFFLPASCDSFVHNSLSSLMNLRLFIKRDIILLNTHRDLKPPPENIQQHDKRKPESSIILPYKFCYREQQKYS